jgi:non-ribosomal peptide synthetase component F
MSSSRRVKYYNVYGPTECTVDSTVCGVSESRLAAIGRPISNTSIYILDNAGRVAPAGMIGEIHIGGAGVARGYMGDAGMTAEKFVPDQFGRLSGYTGAGISGGIWKTEGSYSREEKMNR